MDRPPARRVRRIGAFHAAASARAQDRMGVAQIEEQIRTEERA